MMKNTTLILGLQESLRRLRLNIEFLQFAYGRVGVFNRQFPPLYYGSLGAMDADGLVTLTHSGSEYVDPQTRAGMRSSLLRKVHARWVQGFRHLLSLDAGHKALADSWEASFSALLASQQTHIQQLYRSVDELRTALHERHTKLMQSAAHTERVLQIRPQGLLDDAANPSASSSSQQRDNTQKAAVRRNIHKVATTAALADAASSLAGLPRASQRSPSPSPPRSSTTATPFSDAYLDLQDQFGLDTPQRLRTSSRTSQQQQPPPQPPQGDMPRTTRRNPAAGAPTSNAPTAAHSLSTASTTGSRARSVSVDRARRARALQHLKQRVTKGTGSLEARASSTAASGAAPSLHGSPFSTSRRPIVAHGRSSPAAATTIRKAVPYASMVSRVQAAAATAAKPWEGKRSRPTSRANSVTRARSRAQQGDDEQDEEEEEQEEQEQEEHPRSYQQHMDEQEQSRDVSPAAMRHQRSHLSSQQQQQQQQQPSGDHSHPSHSRPAASDDSRYSDADTSHAHFTVHRALRDSPAALMHADAMQVPSDGPDHFSSRVGPDPSDTARGAGSSHSTATHAQAHSPSQYHLAPMPHSRLNSPQFGSDPASLASPMPQPLRDSAHPFPYVNHLVPGSSNNNTQQQQQRQSLFPALRSPEQVAASAPRPFDERFNSAQAGSTLSPPSAAVPPRSPGTAHMDRAMSLQPDLSRMLSQRSAQVESLALLNEKLREKLEEFRVQNLENVNVADKEIATLARENQALEQQNQELEARVQQLQEEKAMLLKG